MTRAGTGVATVALRGRGARTGAGPLAVRRLAAVGVALACVAAFVVLDRVFVGTVHGQLVDQATHDGGATGSLAVARTARAVLEVVSATTLSLAALVVVAIAVAQRRGRAAVAAVTVLSASTLTTQVLKHVLITRPDLFALGGPWPAANSLPSGHTTFAASVSAALLLAVPSRLRPLAALAGAGWTAVTGAATLALHWHRASDVVAAVLVVGAWTALASLLLRPEECGRAGGSGGRAGGGSGAGGGGRRVGRAVALTVLGAGALLGALVGGSALVVVWLATSSGALGQTGQHVAFVGGAVGAGALACAVMAAQLLLLPVLTAPDTLDVAEPVGSMAGGSVRRRYRRSGSPSALA